MDRFLSAMLLLLLLGFSGYSVSDKPIPSRYAIFAALFLFVTAIDVQHNSMHILLYCGVICLAAGIYAIVNPGQNYNGNYPTKEIAEQIRRGNIFFYMATGILAMALYFGLDNVSQYILAALCVLLTAVIFINAHQTEKISKKIQQWKREHVSPNYLPTDTEVRAVNRSYIKAGLIVIAGIAISVCYMMYNPVFPIDEHDLRGIMVYKGEIISEHHYEISGENVTRLVDALNQLELEEQKELSGYSYKGSPELFEQRNAFTEQKLYEIDIHQASGPFSRGTIMRSVSVCEDRKIRVECLEQAGKEKYYVVVSDDYEEFLNLLDEISNVSRETF